MKRLIAGMALIALTGCAQTSLTVSKSGEITGTTKTFGRGSEEVVEELKKAMEMACSPQKLRMASTPAIKHAVKQAVVELDGQGNVTNTLLPSGFVSELGEVKEAFEIVRGMLWDVFKMEGYCLAELAPIPAENTDTQ